MAPSSHNPMPLTFYPAFDIFYLIFFICYMQKGDASRHRHFLLIELP